MRTGVHVSASTPATRWRSAAPAISQPAILPSFCRSQKRNSRRSPTKRGISPYWPCDAIWLRSREVTTNWDRCPCGAVGPAAPAGDGAGGAAGAISVDAAESATSAAGVEATGPPASPATAPPPAGAKPPARSPASRRRRRAPHSGRSLPAAAPRAGSPCPPSPAPPGTRASGSQDSGQRHPGRAAVTRPQIPGPAWWTPRPNATPGERSSCPWKPARFFLLSAEPPSSLFAWARISF